MALLNDYTFLTLATSSAPVYCGLASAAVTGIAGKALLGVDFGKSFLLTIFVLAGFYLSQMMMLFLLMTQPSG